MSSAQKSRKRMKAARAKRRSRRATYLFGLLVLIIIVGVGWYVYASGQPPKQGTAGDTTDIVYANINTSKGLIKVELYQSKAPKTVTNFVNLANSGFYANLVWHRIVNTPSFGVIQTGDPNTKNGEGDRASWGSGSSSQTVPVEADSSLHNYAGYLGMARAQERNSGSSQFYINLIDNTSLDGDYTVFGKVTSGMNVVSAIANSPLAPGTEQPADPVPLVTSITIASSP